MRHSNCKKGPKEQAIEAFKKEEIDRKVQADFDKIDSKFKIEALANKNFFEIKEALGTSINIVNLNLFCRHLEEKQTCNLLDIL